MVINMFNVTTVIVIYQVNQHTDVHNKSQDNYLGHIVEHCDMGPYMLFFNENTYNTYIISEGNDTGFS